MVLLDNIYGFSHWQCPLNDVTTKDISWSQKVDRARPTDHLKTKKLGYAKRQLLVVTEFLIEHSASSQHGMELRIKFPAIQL
jgi:hypothetical protein